MGVSAKVTYRQQLFYVFCEFSMDLMYTPANCGKPTFKTQKKYVGLVNNFKLYAKRYRNFQSNR